MTTRSQVRVGVLIVLLAGCSSTKSGPQPFTDAGEVKAVLDAVIGDVARTLVQARKDFEAKNPGGPPPLPKADAVTAVTVPCPGGGSIVVQMAALPGPSPFDFRGTARFDSCAIGTYVLAGELAVTVRADGAGFVLELSGQLVVTFGGRTATLDIEKLTITWGSATSVCYAAQIRLSGLTVSLRGGTGCASSPDGGGPGLDAGARDQGSSGDGGATMGGFTRRTSPVAGLSCLTWDGARYVARGAKSALAESPDGITWTAMPNTGLPTDGTIRSLAFSPALKRYVALLHRSGTNLTYVYTLTQGQSSWTDADHGANGHRQVIWAGDPLQSYFMLTSQLYRSSDGLTWKIVDTGGWQTPNSVAYGGAGAQLLVAGDGGTIYSSPDGAKWTPQSAGTLNHIATAAGIGKRWVILLAANAGLYSSNDDGVSWTKVALAKGGKPYSLHRTGDRFLVTTMERQAYFSSDGATYTGGEVFLPSQSLTGAANGDGPRVVVLALGVPYTAEK